jgi:PAS domain S-box-containing protein
MLSGLSDGLLFCNSDNKILLLNQAAETILGISKAKLIDQSIFALPLGDGSGWLIEVLNGVNTNMRFNSMAFKTRINNHFVQIRFAPIFGQNNYYLGGFLYLTEVEENSRIERAERQFVLNEKIFDILHLTSPKIIAEG